MESAIHQRWVLKAGKKGAKRVNYCFITFENWRSAQRACNQSERNVHGKVCTHRSSRQPPWNAEHIRHASPGIRLHFITHSNHMQRVTIHLGI